MNAGYHTGKGKASPELPVRTTTATAAPITVSAMPARIGPKNPRRVYPREWRESKGLTQEQVAQRLGLNVAKATVSRWENGRRRIPLEAYAEALGVPVEKLYELPPHPHPRLQEKRTGALPGDLDAKIAAAVEAVLKQYGIRRR